MQLTSPSSESETTKTVDPQDSQSKPESTILQDAPAATAVTQEASPASAERKSFSWMGFFFDSFLVLLTISILGGGAYYLYMESQRYYIPSPLEQEQARSEELFKRIEALQKPAYLADENLRLKQKLDALLQQEAKLNKSLAEAQQARESFQTRIIAQKKALLRAHSDAKRLAKQQIAAGMRIGTLTTVDGTIYNDCFIRRITGKKIVISHSAGQAPFDIDRLSLDSLPRLVSFALGKENLLDTSDLLPSTTAAIEASSSSSSANRVREANLSMPVVPKSVPVIDTTPIEPSRATPNRPAGDRWVAPTEALPF